MNITKFEMTWILLEFHPLSGTNKPWRSGHTTKASSLTSQHTLDHGNFSLSRSQNDTCHKHIYRMNSVNKSCFTGLLTLGIPNSHFTLLQLQFYYTKISCNLITNDNSYTAILQETNCMFTFQGILNRHIDLATVQV